VPIHRHVHETLHEIRTSIEQHGVRPLERLKRLGIVGPRLIAVHSVHLEEGEIDVMAREGVSVAHCPSSNLKLASGFAPVAAMRARGMRVGLGTDGAASNNRLDMMMEMRTAALVAKGASGNASAVGAEDALGMATLESARALGLEDEVGSIEAGKSADLAAIELDSLETLPLYNPVSQLVYAAGREHVTHVWIDGRLQLRDGELQSNAFARLDTRVAFWQNALGALAGH